jgi:sulfur carrier protein
MKIKVNGKIEIVEGDLSLARLIADRKFCSEKIVVEYNARIVPAGEWEKVIIGDNDCIEIVSFVGGG